ncbi:MAG: hypothetical protein IPM59_05595 [Chloracidobacterium sp.]|nr:hypothetical protein [Chloracidobacterium sp.]
MLRTRLSLIALFVVAVMSAGTAWPVDDGDVMVTMDACKNVTFRVTNGRNVAIEIKQVKYYDATKGAWKTEDITNAAARCEKGAACTIGGNGLFNWKGEDLADAEGNRLTKVVFVYQDVNSNTRHESQAFSPTDPVCRAEKEYGHGQGWTIAGSSDASSQTSPTLLGDACKNVSFNLRHNLNEPSIYIDKVKFYNRNSGKWKTENVKEVSCHRNETCTVGGKDNLTDAKDDDITKIIFIYFTRDDKYKKNPDKESKTFVPQSPKCKEGKVYGTGQGWTIGPPTLTLTPTTRP